MLKRAAKFKVVSAGFCLSLVFVVGGWLWAHFALRNVPQPLILHFNNYVGINKIGTLADVAGIGILGVVVVFVNFLIALALEERDQFLGKLTAAATLFFSILLFIGFAAIIGVN